MSASNKKLRNENASANLTERQIAEQKEAKQVKIYTIAFFAVLALMVVVAIYSGVTNAIASSGVNEKKTVAATVGSHSINNAELSYYYMDAVSNFSSTYGEYAFMYGVDTSLPLNEQVFDEATGDTWADYFVDQAVSSAQTVYALADAAAAEGYVLPTETQDQIDIMSGNLDAYATMYGYKDADAFLKAQYGNGASKQTYLEYYQRNMLASSFQAAHEESLTYTDEEIRTADSANPAAYSAYNYNQYYVSNSRFLTGGTTDEAGNTTYSDAERAAAAVAAAEAAESLAADKITSVEEFDAAIASLSCNEGTEAASTAYTNQSYSAINPSLAEWVTDASRRAGDKVVIPVTSTSVDENGNEVESTDAYYAVYFNGMNTNETELVNVRHILVSFSGDTNEDGTYTDEAKAAAMESAENILNEWKDGDATEDGFAALANQHSTDTGSNTNGGLYENVYPGQMVTAFNDWCFDAARVVGDTDIVETNYGYHVMYFVGTTGQTYRDYQITNELRSADVDAWFSDLIDGCSIVEGDTQYLKKDLVMAR